MLPSQVFFPIFFFLWCGGDLLFPFHPARSYLSDHLSRRRKKNKNKIRARESTTHWDDGGLVDSPEISENQHAEESSSSAGLDDDDDDRPHTQETLLSLPLFTMRTTDLLSFSSHFFSSAERDGCASFHFSPSLPPHHSFWLAPLDMEWMNRVYYK